VNGSPLQLALREMQDVLRSRTTRLGVVFAVFLLTVSGPFGTFENFGVGQRAGYWAAMVVISYLAGQGATTFFLELLRPLIAQRWPRVIIAGLLAALPLTVVVVAINSVAYQRFELPLVFNMWVYVTLITLAIVVALVMFTDRLAQPAAPVASSAAAPVASSAAAPVADTPPPILERVPLPQRGRLLALIVEDHYVDIVTDRGKALVLMRLADAMRETGNVAGLQIHRSHWVARDAVVRTHRSDGRVLLELSNGLRLPVSRGFLPAVKEAGFIG
jgi:DNA-binding LytR/AlgR family response regulator